MDIDLSELDIFNINLDVLENLEIKIDLKYQY